MVILMDRGDTYGGGTVHGDMDGQGGHIWWGDCPWWIWMDRGDTYGGGTVHGGYGWTGGTHMVGGLSMVDMDGQGGPHMVGVLSMVDIDGQGGHIWWGDCPWWIWMDRGDTYGGGTVHGGYGWTGGTTYGGGTVHGGYGWTGGTTYGGGTVHSVTDLYNPHCFDSACLSLHSTRFIHQEGA